MIHAYIYNDGSAFCEVKNCVGDNGKPVVYAKQFETVAQIREAVPALSDALLCGIVWHIEKVAA